jgi:hypothetical protein
VTTLVTSLKPASLADVLRAVSAANLTPRRKQDLASAVRTVARLLGAEPERLPISPRLLADRLNEVSPLANGISPGRWDNLRSLLRAALSLLGPIAPGRHLGGMSPEWTALYDQIGDRPVRSGISRLLHFCSAAGVEPDAFTPAVFESFAASLDRSLLKNPKGAIKAAKRAWAKARTRVPDWPAIDLSSSAPTPVRAYALAWSAFPVSLTREVFEWLAKLGTSDLLDGGDFKPVRPRTLKTREAQLRRFASGLVLAGRDISSLHSLATLVEPKTVKDGLQFQISRRNLRPGDEAPSDIASMAGVLLAIARHWVVAPPEQVKPIASMVRRLRPRRKGMTQRNRGRLRPFDDPEMKDRLIALPQVMMSAALAAKSPLAAARLGARAVAVEFLLVAPMRLANLVGLDLERHFIRSGKNSASVTIVIPGAEVKNGRDLEFPLPARSIELLDTYRLRLRPALASVANTALFPGRFSGAMEGGWLSKTIAAGVWHHLGIRVHTHLFRHITAKLYLDRNPGDLETVRIALGHYSTASTAENYAGMEGPAALRHFDSEILRPRTS